MSVVNANLPVDQGKALHDVVIGFTAALMQSKDNELTLGFAPGLGPSVPIISNGNAPNVARERCFAHRNCAEGADGGLDITPVPGDDVIVYFNGPIISTGRASDNVRNRGFPQIYSVRVNGLRNCLTIPIFVIMRS
jgi:hypothetical protein